MNLSPTPFTASLAGLFSAVTWPLLWARFGQESASGSTELILGTVVLVALPAHAFVIGFARPAVAHSRSLDKALLKRIACWLGSAGVALALNAVYRWA